MPDAPVRILLVEDSLTDSSRVRAILTRAGYAVDVARTGAQAIDRAEIERPDLVFMDIGLEGGMDGVEAAVVVGRRTGLPVVFLTGSADSATLERAREAEPYGYLLKPVDPRQLRPTVEMALNKARLEAERGRLDRQLAEARETIAELRALLRIAQEGPAV